MKKTDDYYMELAIKESEHSTCYKRQIGAVIVNVDEIVSSGHNGGPDYSLHSRPISENDRLAVHECYYEKLAKQTAKERGIEWGTTEALVIKKEFRLFCLSLCAEKTSILNAVKKGLGNKLKGSTIYCTTYPCPACAHTLAEVGIAKLFYINFFDPKSKLNQETKRIFDEAKMVVGHIDIETTQGKRLGFYTESIKYYN